MGAIIPAPPPVTVVPITSGSSYTATATSTFSSYPIYNTSGSAFTFTLPASPAKDQTVSVTDAGLNATTYAITIAGNGKTISETGSADRALLST